ncbi:hypothetical protein [Nocardia jejuensis]|uniref:hypothetical protein n=1 Tax=Nocardia jejuensis TaxID=328049 RepID=UPI00082A22FA|nr:hypothetical protein [Nocardia jejuensis]
MRTPVLLALTAAVLTATAACTSTPHHDTPAPAGPAPADPGRAPAQVRWEPWQGVALPYSTIDGPKLVAGAAAGFSRTPQGAALAAIQHSIRTSLSPDGFWAAVAAKSLVSGPGKDAYVLARAQVSISGPADPKARPSILGYRIEDWNLDHTTLTVFTRYPDSSEAALHHEVDWLAGDWKLQLPDPDSPTAPVEEISATPADMVAMAAPR